MSGEVAGKQTQAENVPEKTEPRRTSGRGSGLRFNSDIEIFPDVRLPEYDVREVKAYRAVGREQDEQYFALVCERHLVPRIRSIQNYAGFNNPFLVPFVAAGVVDWAPARQQRYVLIYKDVLGKRLQTGNQQAMGWRQDDVMNIVVKPMMSALLDFKNRDFSHGAIRPGNMFYSGSASKPERIMLGECLSVPTSYDQPVLYETIERGMVAPVARGESTVSDDIYSFGVSLAVFMRSNDPLEGLTDEEIVRAKIEQGSYGAITGKERFKGSILELLRGILHDDPAERWTVEEIMMWLDGRRLSPKQPLKEKKAPRPVTFSGKKYYQSSLLAMSLDTNPADVVRLVETGELEQWLERSLEDDKALERVQAAVKTARDKGTGSGYEDRLASTLSIALDTKAPVRFKGLRMTGDGIGKALAETMILKRDVQPFVDLFGHNMAYNWISIQENKHFDIGSLVFRFDSCRNSIRQGKIGYGVERCVYLLCPEIHCLSEKLADYFIQTPEDMLIAFEDLCQKGKAPVTFLDRHSTAFLSVKDPKVIDSFIFDIGSHEEYKKILGNLKCLAVIQKRSNMPPMRGVAQAFMQSMNVICERYHDREARASVQKSVARYAQEGDLTKMAMIITSPDLIQRDIGGFREAMKEYALLSREATSLGAKLDNRATFGRNTGREIAAIISSIIAAIIMLGVTFMYFTTRNPIF